ncbi:hypothetical protein M885DRAFT_615089 [Pelagophyceae sp. CCMP2097]|nr:hypothetical protein M885DRAFT_615089 [Pelagophyceae sp. CCMP2097]
MRGAALCVVEGATFQPPCVFTESRGVPQFAGSTICAEIDSKGGKQIITTDRLSNCLRAWGPNYGALGAFAGKCDGAVHNSTDADSLLDARFFAPNSCSSDGPCNALIVVADTGNDLIRAIDVAAGTVTTLAGTGARGCADGPAADATFGSPKAVVYAADFCPENVAFRIFDSSSLSMRVLVTDVSCCTQGAGGGAAPRAAAADRRFEAAFAVCAVVVAVATVLFCGVRAAQRWRCRGAAPRRRLDAAFEAVLLPRASEEHRVPLLQGQGEAPRRDDAPCITSLLRPSDAAGSHASQQAAIKLSVFSIVERILKGQYSNVDVVLAGSAGKGTDIGSSDVDVVVLFDEGAIDLAADALEARLEEVKDVLVAARAGAFDSSRDAGGALHRSFLVHDIHVDVLCGVKLPRGSAGAFFVARAAESTCVRRRFAASAAPHAVAFFKRQPPAVIEAIRRLKLWRDYDVGRWSHRARPSSTVLELLVVHASAGAAAPGENAVRHLLIGALQLAAQWRSVHIDFRGPFYDDAMLQGVRAHLDLHPPCILDPVDCTNNVARNVRVEQAAEFAALAQRALDALLREAA